MKLFIDERRGISDTGARCPVAVDPVIPIREAKRNPADHPPVAANTVTAVNAHTIRLIIKIDHLAALILFHIFSFSPLFLPTQPILGLRFGV